LLDENHASKLCGIFEQGGLNRKAEENYLRVLCSADDVQRMLNSLGRDTASSTDDIPDFRNWSDVNNGRQVELMAGQHRVRALGRYMEKTGCGEEEAWWTCEFYDKGMVSHLLDRMAAKDHTDRIPLDLNITLRVNRRDPSLADSHGQSWAQLVSAACQNPELFRGKNSDVERQMLDILQLNREARFPVKRLVTLWKNARWKAMITRWCETGLGRATFKISTWEWMSTCRIDDVSEPSPPRLHDLTDSSFGSRPSAAFFRR